MKSENVIDVALPSDQNYYPGLLVTVYSIAKRASRTFKLRLHILDGGICDTDFERMEEAACAVNSNVQFVRHKVYELDYSAFPLWKGNRMAYVRMALPTLLPDLDFVLYVDSDMLWLADITELWELRNDCVLLQAVRDTRGLPREIPWFDQHKIPLFQSNYFNNGLLLMNLRRFREEGVIEKVSRFLNKNTDVVFADQSGFNAILGEHVRLLPPHWDLFALDIPNTDLKCPLVIHYVAGTTPWIPGEYCWTVRPYLSAWLEEYAAAANISRRAAYEKFGYRLKPRADWVVMFVARHQFLRRLVTVPLRIIGLSGAAHAVNSSANRCGKLLNKD